MEIIQNVLKLQIRFGFFSSWNSKYLYINDPYENTELFVFQYKAVLAFIILNQFIILCSEACQ